MAKRQDRQRVVSNPGEFAADRDLLRDLVRDAVQELMEAEISEVVGAERSERVSGRSGYRNGYKPRSLNTRVGTLDLSVPQERAGRYHPSVFDRYSRSERALLLAIREMIVCGVSTRKVRKVARLLGVERMSSSTASRIMGILDEQISAWLSRPLEKEYPYLVVDAKYGKVRENGRVVSCGVLVVVGIDSDGYRDILGVYVDSAESESSWGEVFGDLLARGLHGVELIVSDHHEGLMKAVARYFSGASWQRCMVHYLRNALAKVAKQDRGEVVGWLRAIWQQPTLEAARKTVDVVVSALMVRHTALAAWLESTVEDTLSIYFFPREFHKKLRSTNMLERLNQELERRMRPIRIFPSRESLRRMAATICMEQAEDWDNGRHYIKIEHERPFTESNHQHNMSLPILQNI